MLTDWDGCICMYILTSWLNQLAIGISLVLHVHSARAVTLQLSTVNMHIVWLTQTKNLTKKFINLWPTQVGAQIDYKKYAKIRSEFQYFNLYSWLSYCESDVH